MVSQQEKWHLISRKSSIKTRQSPKLKKDIGDRGSGWGGGGSGIHYSLNNLPIIHLIKILGYSLK